LPDVLRDHPQLAAVGRITLLQSLQCVPLALWDEKAQRLVSFEQADMGRFGPSDRRSATSGPPGRSAISPRSCCKITMARPARYHDESDLRPPNWSIFG
jgi:hypothetical protein